MRDTFVGTISNTLIKSVYHHQRNGNSENGKSLVAASRALEGIAIMTRHVMVQSSNNNKDNSNGHLDTRVNHGATWETTLSSEVQMAGAPVAGSTELVVVFIGSKSSITSISIQVLFVVVSIMLLPCTIPSCSTFSRLSSLDRMTESTFS